MAEGKWKLLPCGGGNCCSVAPSITCTNCSSNTGPGEYKVVLAGVSNGTCSSCGSYDGTYILPFSFEAFGRCEWTIRITPLCGFEFEDLVVRVFPDQSVDIVLIGSGSVIILAGTESFFPDDPDCLDFVDHSFNLGSLGTCANAGTAELTALV